MWDHDHVLSTFLGVKLEECIWNTKGVIIGRGKRKYLEKESCPFTTSSFINSTRTALELNPCLRRIKQTKKRKELRSFMISRSLNKLEELNNCGEIYSARNVSVRRKFLSPQKYGNSVFMRATFYFVLFLATEISA